MAFRYSPYGKGGPGLGGGAAAGGAGNYKTRLCNYYELGACTRGEACNFAHGAEELRQFTGGSVGGGGAGGGTVRAAGPGLISSGGGWGKATPAWGAGWNGGGAAAGAGASSWGAVGGGGGGGPGAFKTKICTFYEQGRCNKGDQCSYAHGAEELQAGGGGQAAAPAARLGNAPAAVDSYGGYDAASALLGAAVEAAAAWGGKGSSWGAGASAGTGGGLAANPGAFKTKMCAFFERGACTKGDQCTYAHGDWELQGSGAAGGLGKGAGYGGKAAAAAVAGLLGGKLGGFFGGKAAGKAGLLALANGAGWGGKSSWDSWGGGSDWGGAGAAKGGKGGKASGGVPTAFNFKTRLCTFFEQGTCTRGDACSFAHGAQELATPGSATAAAAYEQAAGHSVQQETPSALEAGIAGEEEDPLAAAVAAAAAAGQFEPFGAAAPAAGGVGPYKTRLCLYFQQGRCTRGEACTFAHGEEELSV